MEDLVDSEELGTILTIFLELYKGEIFDFFNRCYSYINDLLVERNVDLRIELSSETDDSIQNTIGVMLRTIRLAFMTIGISNQRLMTDEKKLIEIVNEKRAEYTDYKSCFEKDLKKYINKSLLEILIEYLIDLDIKKIQNLDLFDLLPRYFVDRLDKFKQDNITSTQIKDLIKEIIPEIEDHIDLFTLSIKLKAFKVEEDILIKPATSLKLKTFITESEPSTQEIPPLQELSSPEMEPIIKIKYLPKMEIPIQITKPSIREPPVQKQPEDFLDYFGNYPPINSDVIKKFSIDINNLIKSKNKTPEFFNLENLFYYIAILKMLNIEIPFTHSEIFKISKNYVNDKIFSSSRYIKPDSISIFFGLGIFSELNLFESADIVDLVEIKKFLESEIKDFLPEKLRLNFYTLLSFKLLEKNGLKIADKSDFILKILNLDILSNLEEGDLILDIFEHLASIKLLDKEADLSNFRAHYTMELKTLITPKGLIEETITDSARALLIFDMLNLKWIEFDLIQNLLNRIIYCTKFFTYEHLDKKFNWQIDNLAYTVELRMLFWALLACSQYSSILI